MKEVFNRQRNYDEKAKLGNTFKNFTKMNNLSTIESSKNKNWIVNINSGIRSGSLLKEINKIQIGDTFLNLKNINLNSKKILDEDISKTKTISDNDIKKRSYDVLKEYSLCSQTLTNNAIQIITDLRKMNKRFTYFGNLQPKLKANQPLDEKASVKKEIKEKYLKLFVL